MSCSVAGGVAPESRGLWLPAAVACRLQLAVLVVLNVGGGEVVQLPLARQAEAARRWHA